MNARPNIVFIHVDQWRADCLSIDGHPVVHTPTLDKMASKGVRFLRILRDRSLLPGFRSDNDERNDGNSNLAMTL
jgi:hypothetical protein